MHLWNGTQYLPKLARAAEGSQRWVGEARVGALNTKVFLFHQSSSCIYMVYCSLLLFGLSVSLEDHVRKDGPQ